MKVVIKNGEAIMDLADKAQYMDEFIRKVKSVVTIAELEITTMALFFSRPIPEDITPVQLYARLNELLDAIYRVKGKLTGDYLIVAQNIGFMSRLTCLQEAAETAKVGVRKDIHH